MENKRNFLRDISLIVISVLLSFFSVFIASKLGALSSANKTTLAPDLVASIQESRKSVVNIFLSNENGSMTVGSGVMYSKDSNYVYIITNHHVIEDEDFESDCFIYLYNGYYNTEISLVGGDSVSDIAVLKAPLNGFFYYDADNSPKTDAKFSPSIAKIGPAMDKLRFGEPVFAVGNPYGFTNSVTVGVVSSTYREIDLQGYTKYFIQTDTAINGGNSGGGLFNINGELIGINALKLSGSTVDNMAFSIPILYDSTIRLNNTTYERNKIDALTTANILRADGTITTTRTFGVAFDYLSLIIDNNKEDYIYVDALHEDYEPDEGEWTPCYIDEDDTQYYQIVSKVYKGTTTELPSVLIFDRENPDFKFFDACDLTDILYETNNEIDDEFLFEMKILSITKDGVCETTPSSTTVLTKIFTLSYTPPV